MNVPAQNRLPAEATPPDRTPTGRPPSRPCRPNDHSTKFQAQYGSVQRRLTDPTLMIEHLTKKLDT
ncbi:hypothetical protein FAF44_12670 [Nonomuraea sp. MG754425]|uniref:hypothetical protein n=1 Tax=Nonomuraea sp. MG754425 TaxID=2570319 RepID=UPI001F2671E6|nr:hypothetical protein [Nonomuraea sp. MG754425]MCF6469241.1 hypothetical protein [Nonomuraea sp. MG754425]